MDAEIRARGNLVRSPGHGTMQLWSRKITNLADFHEAIKERDAREDDLASRCREIQYDLVHRGKVDPNPLYKWLESEITQLSRDPDLFVFLTRPPASTPYPAVHSCQVARLSMAVAAHLRWSHEEIIAVGAGAFVHDAGMLRLSDRIYRTRNRIDSLQRQDLIKHPVYALDLVGLENDLHEYMRYIAYQVHERCNGSGYPRAWPMGSIHPAARLVGLVDAYVAMVSHRPHRNPLLPHQAILEIMQEAHAGQWEAAITRGLLRTVSLYPIGSFVELSDGRLARGVQANAKDHRRPMLEVWVDPAAIALEPGELLDLSTETRINVSRAVPPPQVL
ncbi:MAG: HD domain-containing protein [Planctomycetota bacterium]